LSKRLTLELFLQLMLHRMAVILKPVSFRST